MSYIEERLKRDNHFVEVGDFNCGPDDPLNWFLTDRAFDYDENKYGLTYLLKDKETGIILAFYTVKANGIQTYDAENGEYNSVPVIEIARIAVEYDLQNVGLGKTVFYDYILPKIRNVENLIAVKGVIVFVEPDNEQGIRFYKSLGFLKAEDDVQKEIAETFNEDCDLYVLELAE